IDGPNLPNGSSAMRDDIFEVIIERPRVSSHRRSSVAAAESMAGAMSTRSASDSSRTRKLSRSDYMPKFEQGVKSAVIALWPPVAPPAFAVPLRRLSADKYRNALG